MLLLLVGDVLEVESMTDAVSVPAMFDPRESGCMHDSDIRGLV
jgi:hypothetical protein